jgi:hypothetical protein
LHEYSPAIDVGHGNFLRGFTDVPANSASSVCAGDAGLVKGADADC